MIANAYLAEIEEPSLWGTSSECLVVFIDGHQPPTCLTDPEVISFQPAAGHWCLLGADHAGGRAFYTRFDHTAPLTCESPARSLLDGS